MACSPAKPIALTACGMPAAVGFPAPERPSPYARPEASCTTARVLVPPASTAVEVTFESDAGETLVRLTHRQLPAPAVEFHRSGWEHYLPRLAITAAGGHPGPDPWSAGEPRP